MADLFTYDQKGRQRIERVVVSNGTRRRFSAPGIPGNALD